MLFPPPEDKMKKVRVGIDFDGTITADYHTWLPLIRIMQLAGWELAIVTWRPSHHNKEVNEFLNLLAIKIPVIYCNGCAKRDCFDADIWIDDNPASVNFHLGRTPSFAPKDGSELYILSTDPNVEILATDLEVN